MAAREELAAAKEEAPEAEREAPPEEELQELNQSEMNEAESANSFANQIFDD